LAALRRKDRAFAFRSPLENLCRWHTGHKNTKTIVSNLQGIDHEIENYFGYSGVRRIFSGLRWGRERQSSWQRHSNWQ